MDKHKKRSNTSKIYCEKCNTIFDSKEKFEQHAHNQSVVTCDSCPLDVAMQRILNLFRRN